MPSSSISPATQPARLLREELTDPVTLDLLDDPVSVPCCGKAFSRSSIVHILDWAESAGFLGDEVLSTSSSDPDDAGNEALFRCPLCKGNLGQLGFHPRTAAKNVSLAALVDLLKTGEAGDEDDASVAARLLPAVEEVRRQQNVWKARFTPVVPSGSSASAPPPTDDLMGELTLSLTNASFKPRPALFIAALDRSGSMSGRPYEQVKTAVKHIWSLVHNGSKKTNVKLILLSYGSDCFEMISGPEDYRIGGGTNFRAVFAKVAEVLER